MPGFSLCCLFCDRSFAMRPFLLVAVCQPLVRIGPFPCVFSWLSNPLEGNTFHNNLHPPHPTTMATCTATTTAGTPCGALSGPCYGCSSTTWTPPTTPSTPYLPHGHPTSHFHPPPLGPRPPFAGRRRPFSTSSPPPLHPRLPPSTASKATTPPALRPLHSVPTPAEFNPDDDHYDTTRVAGYDLPKLITHTAFTRQLGIEGQDIARVSLLNFLHEQWNSWWLRHLAHGGEARIVVAKSMPESVFAAGLLSQIRQRHLDLDALALHVATQEGTSTTKPAAMKLLTSKIFDFLISLRPTTTTDPASAATILQLQQQLAVAHSQLAQQAPSPSPPPTPTSSGKRPADPSQASLLDFGMMRPRLTTSDTPPPDDSPALPLPARSADNSPSPPAPPGPRRHRHPGGFSPPPRPPGRSLATCSSPLPTFANGSPATSHPTFPTTAHRQRRTAKQHNFWQHHCRQFLAVLRFTLRFFPTDDVTARHFCSWLLAQLQLLDVCHLSCGSGQLKALLARLGLDSPASDFSQLVPSAVYLRFTSHPKWQTFFYVGATRTSLMARDHSRFRKLLQVQRHHLVNAELAVRWWAHFDVFHFYASVPIHIAVPATDLFATEQFYIQELQPSLNFGFIERHFRPRTGFIRQLDFSQSRHMGLPPFGGSVADYDYQSLCNKLSLPSV